MCGDPLSHAAFVVGQDSYSFLFGLCLWLLLVPSIPACLCLYLLFLAFMSIYKWHATERLDQRHFPLQATTHKQPSILSGVEYQLSHLRHTARQNARQLAVYKRVRGLYRC